MVNWAETTVPLIRACFCNFLLLIPRVIQTSSYALLTDTFLHISVSNKHLLASRVQYLYFVRRLSFVLGRVARSWVKITQGYSEI